MEKVTYEIVERTAIVTINNPPLNVLSKEVINRIYDIFQELETDDEAVSVILTGAGDKAFVAGADIKEFPEWMGQANFKEIVMDTHRMFNYIDDFPKPTIALLNGLTFGGGCELAMTCDIRVAEDQAQLGLPEIKLGLFPGGGGTQRLPRLVGEARAKEIMFTGEPITAHEAEQYGLVNHVVPTGQGMTYAQSLASKISDKSLQSLSRIKQAVNKGTELQLEKGIELEADLFDQVFQTEDIKEGVNAFFEKRKPQFTHR
ncbi:enoyl-CoA hydratase [Alkalihalobacillus sp. CinArs1]|uniref:enoyl-CoA hydratase n=1 Tax=Alkalihalobacillus sp. CinArs1 TaxID=2995314 RepID=UPI0022DD6A5B|nr:enoyl-CoA hydratase [Alkalihalobacillus sp. CinArs1]